MEQEQILNSETPVGKIYKDNSIYIGTFIGGPLVAGYLIAENFKVFNETNRVIKTWIYTIISTIVIFGGIFIIPETTETPNLAIPLIYTGITSLLVYYFQRKNINSHINSGGQIYSWKRTIGVGFIGLSITLILIFSFVFLAYALTNASIYTKTYGIMKHEISYDNRNITEVEVNKIAESLTTTTFFDDKIKKYTYAKKVGKDYEILISCHESVTTDYESLSHFTKLKNDTQKLFAHNKIIFNLVVNNLDNIVKRIE